MANDVPPNDGSDPIAYAKGGSYGTVFARDPSLPANVQAILAGYRWSTAADGTNPTTALTYFFPTSEDVYLTDEHYPPKARRVSRTSTG
jgi:hypothetical protein